MSTWTKVQSNSASALGTSVTAFFHSAVTGDNLLVVKVGLTIGGSIIGPESVTDSFGNTYVKHVSQATSGGSDVQAEIWSTTLSGSGTDFVLYQAAQSCLMGVEIAEYSNSGGNFGVDTVSSGTSVSQLLETPPMAVITNNDIVTCVGAAVVDGQIFSAGVGFSLGFSQGGVSGSSVPCGCEDVINFTGSITPTMNISASSKWTLAACAFSSSAPPPPGIMMPGILRPKTFQEPSKTASYRRG